VCALSGLLTVDEVAKELRLAPISVHRRIKDGQLQAVKLGAARSSPVRVDAAELERYLEMSRKRAR
jgi:excisionase family DNA binding protein